MIDRTNYPVNYCAYFAGALDRLHSERRYRVFADLKRIAGRFPHAFYDESLKRQLEGSFVSDGKAIHVSSAYGFKSAPYNDMGACIGLSVQVLLAQKLLSELARGAAKDMKGH